MNAFASIQFSETDKRALIILLILLVISVLLIGLIGVAVRATMHHQAKRADAMMHDVAVTHVIDNPRAFRKFGMKKNNRALYRDSLIPFLILISAILVWVLWNLFASRWGENVFVITDELFIHFKLDNSLYPTDDPLFVRVFGVYVFSRWPETVDGYPVFHAENIFPYFVAFLYTVAGVWYAVVCQAYLARFSRIQRLSTSIYEKSLEGYKAQQDIQITPEKPLPPSD